MTKIRFIVEMGGLGSDNTMIDVGGIKISDKAVKVTRNFKAHDLIGLATVTKEDGVLWAEMEVSDDLLKLNPAVAIQPISTKDNSGVTVFDSSYLLSIGLCEEPNCDVRIKSLREQKGEIEP